MSDRLTFWRNWYTSAKQYPPEQRLAWFDAVLAYAFDGVVPAPSDGQDLTAAIAFGAVEMVKATIEISRSRAVAGKQARSKPKANRKQNRSKPKANPEQEQVQEQVQDKEQYATTTARGAVWKKPGLEEFLDGCKTAGVPGEFAQRLYNDLVQAAWTDGNGNLVRNWRRYVRSAWLEESLLPAAAPHESLIDRLYDPEAIA